jgi:hypothetical protein
VIPDRFDFASCLGCIKPIWNRTLPSAGARFPLRSARAKAGNIKIIEMTARNTFMSPVTLRPPK